jgi:hypothetical protein
MGTTCKGYSGRPLKTKSKKPKGWGKRENYPEYYNRAARRAK